MKIQNIGLASVLGGLGVIASSMTSQALDFNFSFTTTTDNPGTVTGVIKNLQEGTNWSYQIMVNDNPVGITPGTIFDRGASGFSGYFEVTDGSITSLRNISAIHNFGGSVGFGSIQMNSFSGSNNYYYNYLTYGDISSTFDTSVSQYTLESYNFSPVAATAVPFDFNPAEGAALGVPLFIGLGMLRKKKLVQKSAAKKVAELVS